MTILTIVMITFDSVLFLLCVTSLQLVQCLVGDFHHVIYINPAIGRDNPDCLTSKDASSPCGNLTWVFQQGHSDSTHYILSEGPHFLTETTPIFRDLALQGFTGSSSVVTCTDSDTGLIFVDVNNVTLNGITFHNCSSLVNSTSRKYDSNDSNFEFQLYKSLAAFYFYRCRDVTIAQVTVTKSPSATGVVMYNTAGKNLIQHSSFTLNRVESPEQAAHPGGGGFYVEFTYCIPGDNTCDSFNDSIATFNSDASFIFHNVSFRGNKASNLNQHQDTYIIPYSHIQNAFGKGGGLAIIFKGNASSNTFDITECHFHSNEAIAGSGLLVEYQDHSSNNTVLVRNSVFTGNGQQPDAYHTRTRTTETSGGGIKVGHYVFNLEKHPHSTKNRLHIDECEVLGNNAVTGGGMSVFPARQLVINVSQIFELTISNTNFTENQAQIGAAMECTLFSLFVVGQLPLIVLENSKFLNNSIYNDTGDAGIREVGVGVVYTNGIPIQFRNEIEFAWNSGSALAAVGTFANFSHSTSHFTSNRGKYGGGINLLGSAFVLIDNSTSMTFKRNTADVYGGAFANIFIERENFMTLPNCFLHHVIPFLHPDHWGATFRFEDNNAGLLGQSIYTTSLLPCSWAGGSGSNRIEKILCWKGWHYVRNGLSVDCHGEINTDSGHIRFGNQSNNDTEVFDDDLSMPSPVPILTAIPGREFQIPLIIKDDLNMTVNKETVFSAKTLDSEVSQVNPRYTFVSGEFVRVDGAGGNNITLQLQSNRERTWELEVKVQLLSCPPGLVSSHDPPLPESYCECDRNNYQGLVHCDPLTLDTYIINGYWFGRIDDYNQSFVTSLCLPGFCRKEARGALKKIPANEADLEEEVCGGENHRQGILCGECKDGYGPSVNRDDYQCVLCNDTTVTVNIFKYLLSVYLPLFLLFVFIIVFSVRLTSGPANAFIFYAQVVTSNFDLNADRHIPLNLITHHSTYLLNAYRIPYGIFNLEFIENFIRPLCIGAKLSALDVLELDYVIAFFPVLMIVGVVVLVKVKDRLSGLFRCCGCNFRRSGIKFLRHWKVNESLLHAFSAFLLLSYTKFSLTSSYLVNIHPFYNSNGEEVGTRRSYYAGQYTANDWEYLLRYKIPACLVLALVALPPIVLLGYPVVWFEKCIIRIRVLWNLYPADKVQIFLDTFQGCYKDNRRFFAGMYFVFRLTINVCYILTDNWLQQFVIQQVICTVFIFIVAFLWPYREEKWYVNYVDLLIFTNLAIVNALSLYLFVFAQINAQSHSIPLWPFVIQYILVFIPLLYMVVYVAWFLLSPSQQKTLTRWAMMPVKKFRKRQKEKYLRTTLLGPSEGVQQRPSYSSTQLRNAVMDNEPVSTTEVTLPSEWESESHSSHGSDEDDLEVMLVRAQTQNTYRSTGSTTSTTPYQQWVEGATKVNETDTASKRTGKGDGAVSESS